MGVTAEHVCGGVGWGGGGGGGGNCATSVCDGCVCVCVFVCVWGRYVCIVKGHRRVCKLGLSSVNEVCN